MNGPENISQFLRVPIADQPALGILRLNTTEARELALNAGQTVRGIVAGDGDSVTLLLPNQPRRFRANFGDLKGQSLDFDVSRSAYGVTIKPVEQRQTLLRHAQYGCELAHACRAGPDFVKNGSRKCGFAQQPFAGRVYLALLKGSPAIVDGYARSYERCHKHAAKNSCSKGKHGFSHS